MKLFFTGATGLVGTAIREAFSQQPFEIKALSRKQQPPATNTEWILSDISDNTLDLAHHIENTDVIVHNAACLYIGQTEVENEEIQKINVDFTKKLLDWSAANKIQKIVFTSTFSLLAKPLPGLITETADVKPVFPYAESKFHGEQLVQEYAAKYGFQYAILRISSPVSVDLAAMPQTVVKKWISQSLSGQDIQLSGTGTRTQDFIALTDIAQAFVNSVINIDASGIFNIASGSELSMSALAQMITDKFGNRYSMTGNDENGDDRWNISIEKAKQQLNYQPRYSSEQAIAALLTSVKQ
jgi:UDP-glucose 4-epimerase